MPEPITFNEPKENSFKNQPLYHKERQKIHKVEGVIGQIASNLAIADKKLTDKQASLRPSYFDYFLGVTTQNQAGKWVHKQGLLEDALEAAAKTGVKNAKNALSVFSNIALGVGREEPIQMYAISTKNKHAPLDKYKDGSYSVVVGGTYEVHFKVQNENVVVTKVDRG